MQSLMRLAPMRCTTALVGLMCQQTPRLVATTRRSAASSSSSSSTSASASAYLLHDNTVFQSWFAPSTLPTQHWPLTAKSLAPMSMFERDLAAATSTTAPLAPSSTSPSSPLPNAASPMFSCLLNHSSLLLATTTATHESVALQQLEAAVVDASSSSSESMWMDSVKRKRKRKMNKHKYRKMRKLNRIERRSLGK
jgi:hypothetical protein